MVEFVVAIDEARVRFTDDAQSFFVFFFVETYLISIPSVNLLEFVSFNSYQIGLVKGFGVWT